MTVDQIPRLTSRLGAREQSTQVTQEIRVPCVPATWPVEDFNRYLAALMDRANIRTPAELSGLTGVNASQFSNWKAGKSQPSRESLARIAPVLDVRPVHLWMAAGLVTASQLDSEQDVDLTVLPNEFRSLVDLYMAADTNGQDFIRQQMAIFVRGLSALLSEDPPRPSPKRRRTA